MILERLLGPELAERARALEAAGEALFGRAMLRRSSGPRDPSGGGPGVRSAPRIRVVFDPRDSWRFPRPPACSERSFVAWPFDRPMSAEDALAKGPR